MSPSNKRIRDNPTVKIADSAGPPKRAIMIPPRKITPETDNLPPNRSKSDPRFFRETLMLLLQVWHFTAIHGTSGLGRRKEKAEASRNASLIGAERSRPLILFR